MMQSLRPASVFSWSGCCFTNYLLLIGVLSILSTADSLDEFRDRLPDPYEMFEPMELSNAIYEVDSLVDWKREAGASYTALSFDNTDDTEFALALSNELPAIYVVFRGSESSSDMFANVNYWPLKNFNGEYGAVHRGFHNRFSSLDFDSLIDNRVMKLLSMECEGCRVVFTGHSQGAALALLAGAQFAHDHPRIKTTVYGFGMPRVGNAAFKTNLRNKLRNLRIFRMVFQEDMVPRSPAKRMGFDDAGHLIHWNARRTMAYYQQTGDQSLKLKGVSNDDWDLTFNIMDADDWRTDHGVDSYLGALLLAMGDSRQWPSRFEPLPPPPSPPQCSWWRWWCR